MVGLVKESVLIEAWKIESMVLDPKVADTLRIPWWTSWSFWKFTMTPPNFVSSLYILSSWLKYALLNSFGKVYSGRKAQLWYCLNFKSSRGWKLEHPWFPLTTGVGLYRSKCFPVNLGNATPVATGIVRCAPVGCWALFILRGDLSCEEFWGRFRNNGILD